jgi:hypothetical protein
VSIWVRNFRDFVLRFSCWGIGVVRLATEITVFLG